MAINQELLTGYKRMQHDLTEATSKLRHYESSYSTLRQELLDLRSSVEQTGAVT